MAESGTTSEQARYFLLSDVPAEVDGPDPLGFKKTAEQLAAGLIGAGASTPLKIIAGVPRRYVVPVTPVEDCIPPIHIANVTGSRIEE